MVSDQTIAYHYRKYRRHKTFWLILGGLAGSALATLIMMIMALMLLVLASGRGRYHRSSWLDRLSPAQFVVIFLIALAAVIIIGLIAERRSPGDVGVRNYQDDSDPAVFGAYAVFIFTFAQSAFWRAVMLMLCNRSREETTVVIWLCRRDFGCDFAVIEKSTGVPSERFLPGFLRLNLLVPLADRRKIALASKVKERLMSEAEASFFDIH